ncbi:MAG: cytidine deaminase [Longimonas sp.]|uniref:cytidine deaminase n=1 Tax=Longimonas sp. TaxID=2039626 RepID=UPI0033481EBF
MTRPLLSSAREHLHRLLDRAYVPFSKQPRSVLVVLDDGQWIPGVRIESASYSLSISALGNAVTTAYSLACSGAVAGVVASRPLAAGDRTYLHALAGFNGAELSVTEEDTLASYWRGAPPASLGPAVDPTVPCPTSVADGVQAAHRVAQHAHIPESHFPVGAVLVHDGDTALPGVNVEHPDWHRILCAERNALSTAYAYGYTNITTLYLSCPKAPGGSPCGACRQVLAERAPDATIYMDRHTDVPERSSPADLLPAFFNSGDLVAE